jgi:hypothetical protein
MSTPEDKEDQLVEGAMMVTAQLSNAFDKLADILFMGKNDGDESPPPGLDVSALTAVSTDDSPYYKENVVSYSASDSSPSPPRIKAGASRVRTFTSSAFSPIHRPVPFTPPAITNDPSYESSAVESSIVASSANSRPFSGAESSATEAAESDIEVRSQHHGAYTEIMIQSTPMARMRSDAIASATYFDPKSPSSSPRPSGPEVIANKHRKWRQQMKEVQRRKIQQEQRRQQTSSVCTRADLLLGGDDDPSKMLEKLVRNTRLACANIDDVASEFLSEESFSDSEASGMKTLSPSRSMLGAGSDASPGVTISSARSMIRTVKLATPSGKGLINQEGETADEHHEDKLVQPGKPFISDSDMQDKTFVRSFIQEVSQKGFPLIWHRPSPDGRSFDNPVEIVAFLELGFLQGDGTFAGPRLAWYSPEGRALGAFDLLDIRSLAKATPLHLSDFPFAIPGNSVILRLYNSFDVLVLESLSAEGSRKFIHGLRWVVARLAFNLIIGNKEVSCELLEVSDTSSTTTHSQMSKAMNDVTNQLVDKAVFVSPQKVV